MKLLAAYVLFNTCMLTAFLWSGPKAYRSAIVAGWLAPSSVESVQVAQKARTYTRTWKGMRQRFWLSGSDLDIRFEGPHRIEVERSLWERTRVGDPMTLLHAGDGRAPVWKESVAHPMGSAVLDALVLGAETSGIVWAAMVMRSAAKRRRLHRRGPGAGR